jgi:hypothetical protein
VVGDPEGSPSTSDTTDVFDPTTQLWSDGPVLPAGRQDAVLAALPDGRALLAGGSVGEDAQRAAFVLAAAGTDVPAAAPGSGADSSSPWSWVVGGLVLLVLLTAGVVVARRRRVRPRHG